MVRKPLRYLPVSRTTLNHVEPRWRHEDIAGGLQGLGRVSPSPYGLNLDLCCILNDLKGKEKGGGDCSEDTKVLPPFTWLLLNSEFGNPANNGRVFGWMMGAGKGAGAAVLAWRTRVYLPRCDRFRKQSLMDRTEPLRCLFSPERGCFCL